MAVAGWYADPDDGSRLRWWDGGQWTSWVGLGGQTWAAPLRGQLPASQLPGASYGVAGTPSPPAVAPMFAPSPPAPAYPYPYPYPGQPAATAPEPFRSLKGLGTALLVLFIVAAVGHGITAIALFARSATAARLRDGGDVTSSDLAAADGSVAGAYFVTFLVAVTIYILLTIWLWRAYSNTRLFGASPWRWGRGWTIGGWFIPLANLVIPKSLFNDTWRGADARASGNPRWRKLPVAGIVTVWWVGYIVTGYALGGTTTVYDPETMTPDDLVGLDIVAGIIALLSAGASVLGAIALRMLTRRQHRRAAELGLG